MTQQSLFEATDSTPEALNDYDWTFSGTDTAPNTHGLHTYPARMIPKIARTLLNHWEAHGELTPGDLIYDPFCGSGTTVVEARQKGYDAVATEINPFACQLARAKATPLEPERLYTAFEDIYSDWAIHRRFIHDGHDERAPPEPTAVKSDWFPTPQRLELDSLARRLSEARGTYDHEVIRFLRICLASIVRAVSYQQPGEFKRQRIPEDERESHTPDVWALYCDAVTENIKRMEAYVNAAADSGSVDVRLADCRDPEAVATNSADAVITSPPYGDHRTTVAYGQNVRAPALAAMPLREQTMIDVDPSGLGGTRSGAFTDVGDVTEFSPALEETLDELDAVDGRHDDALDFFADYYECIRQLARVTKPHQPLALVVGNRTMSRVPIPLHLITEEFLEAVDAVHEQSLPRSIPTKTLPWANAPKNEAGNTGALMADEYVVVASAPTHPPENP